MSHSHPPLQTQTLHTRLRCYSNIAALLQHNSWTGWVDVTVWASGPQSLSPLAQDHCSLLRGQHFRKKRCFTSRSVNYVVLTRLSSFLMAANREKNKVGIKLITILLSSCVCVSNWVSYWPIRWKFSLLQLWHVNFVVCFIHDNYLYFYVLNIFSVSSAT